MMRRGTDAPKLRGQRNECPGCGQLFNSVLAFDRHRTGKMSERRCKTTDEMLAKGMIRNAAGFWCSSLRPEMATCGPTVIATARANAVDVS